MFDISVKDQQIIISERALHEMKKLQEFQLTIQEMENEEKEIKQAMTEAMRKAGVKKFENDFISISYVPESTRENLDKAKLKEKHPNIYKECVKESKVKDFVRITYKEND